MRPAAFEYHKATSLEHALTLLQEFGEDGRPLAGGQSLVPMMNLRLARPGHLVDINGLGLDSIEERGDVLHIGALVRHQRYFDDPIIARRLPAFLEAVHWIGHPTIRRHGTLGGSISHADPTAELPAICVLYDAQILVASTAGERRIAAADFFANAYVTTLEPGEMVTGVEFPFPPENNSGAFLEQAERRGDFALAAIGVSINHDTSTITSASIVCAGARLVPTRAPEVEAALVGRALSAPEARAAGTQFSENINPVGDHAASADYRRGLIAELTTRAIERACEKAREHS
ncbi:FAD binding domain-containing protein [Pseudohoeflea coraliihabitans]|uniref:Xanthine dehydrogenase family protein subunit M n=1 Tax=Pseudohoeflea coraliihabitans TaxID=2860393 RepID=A0ABS6WIT2_9HYPH|nr:xanthine dehydrogenase family protein subunit M [Pseudohoeflea sp. DP4N28-3]MBW3095839.1 xanthine dehydrogenase family protein subunit M [Pseudohoeflea sp. DP4N28-3]